MRIPAIIYFCSLLALPVSLSAGDNIQVGEQLTYQLSYGIFNAGFSSMEVLGVDTTHGHITYHLQSRTRTTSFLDTFYKIRDEVNSWVDTSTFASVQFDNSLHEGKYRKDYEVWFDYRDMEAYSSSDTTVKIPGHMQDILSLFYYLRSLDLSVGDTVRMSNYDNDKISPFLLAINGIETVKVPAGTFECLAAQPFSESDFLFKYEGNLQIWLTNDERKIPVMMKSKANFGSMVLKLKHYVSGTLDGPEPTSSSAEPEG